jgi:3-hydroxyisobutyrate dehydrogenase-like beta-hydroxyacid dehydrogenase
VKLRTVTVGILHPGEMGAAIGAVLSASGETVLWASSGRSSATAERAAEGGLEDVEKVEEVVRRSDVVFGVCPPAAAVEVARSVTSLHGIYVDANAVSPATARTIAGLVGSYVDGGIVCTCQEARRRRLPISLPERPSTCVSCRRTSQRRRR